MVSYVRAVILYLTLCRPGLLMTGATVFCSGGIAVGAVVGALVGRRRKTRTWAMDGVLTSLCFVLFCLGDWALLRALPHLRLSFATEIKPPLAASLTLRTAMFWGLLLAALLARWRRRRQGFPVDTRRAGMLFLAANVCFSGVQVYAYVVEPLSVQTTELSFSYSDLDTDAPPVRVVQLTDTHVERNSFREREVVRRVNGLDPDIIVLTGDYLNLSYCSDPVSAAHFRQFVEQLEAPYGIYAVRGSVDPPDLMARLVEGTGVTWLEQEAVTVDVRGQAVTLIGVACSHRLDVDGPRLDVAMGGVPEEAFTLLLYHSPDLIREAMEHGVDLYVGGHTHGGQLRLPFYGAIVTASAYGKKYEAGLYQEGDTTMYISRGLGFEGGGMPRARFLCRPEIVSIDLRGASGIGAEIQSTGGAE